MYWKSSKANTEFDATGKNTSLTGNFARMLKMQNNLCFSLSLCLINSETFSFLAGSHTERDVGASFIIFSVLHVLSPMKMLMI